jgi:hypothetical protein
MSVWSYIRNRRGQPIFRFSLGASCTFSCFKGAKLSGGLRRVRLRRSGFIRCAHRANRLGPSGNDPSRKSY